MQDARFYYFVAIDNESSIYLFGLVCPPVALDRMASFILIFYTLQSMHDTG